MSEKLNDNLDIKEIELSSIDWNKLTINEFHSLEQKLLIKQKLIKSSNRKEIRETGTVFVNLKGNQYIIKKVLYNRLNLMKSEKSKQKLIDDIISSHNIIESI